ncbi:MAG: hypothetical protein ACRECW_11340 [Phyllobacterium sp.]
MQPSVSTDIYKPRAAWFEGFVDCGPAKIKLSIIQAGDKGRLASDTLAKARQKIALASDRLAASNHLGAGYAVLHEGEQGLWLLLHWWLDGGISTQIVWRSDLRGTIEFIDADPLLMACVWELGIIDFERRAWMETAMSGKPVSDYLTRTLPRGTV